jgi:AcrR family transcriptional regulator
MSGRDRWLDEGLRVLAEQGAPALRIDRLAQGLGLSKGSFYHHFDAMPAYRTALLAHFEQHSTMRFIEAVAGAEMDGARARIELLMDLVLDEDDHGLETAVRAWALQDADAHEVLQRVDAVRVDYLEGLCRDLGHGGHSIDSARAFYLVMIGAEQIIPPLARHELRRLWVMILDADRPGPTPRGCGGG